MYNKGPLFSFPHGSISFSNIWFIKFTCGFLNNKVILLQTICPNLVVYEFITTIEPYRPYS